MAEHRCRRRTHLAAARSLALVALIAALPVQASALSARIWVSGRGIDQAGCGPVTSPCRTLQFAHDNISPGGEIDVLDPAGYGVLAISRSVSIINDGVGVAGLFSTEAAPAITIESKDYISVLLRGLTIDGGGSNLASVAFIANGSLTVQNCLVKNSGGLAVFVGTPSSIQVLNSTFSNNVQAIAVNLYGNSQDTNPVKVVIDRTTITGTSGTGIHLSRDGPGVINFLVSNSIVSANGYGMYIKDGVEGVVRTTAVTQNVVGLMSLSYRPVVLTGNTISGNRITGVLASYGTKSFGDNQITGNGTDVDGTLTPVAPR